MASSSENAIKASAFRKLKDFDIRGEKQFHQQYPKPCKIAAVLLPLTICDGEIFLLLTKRAKSLRSYASSAAFPGGFMEETDDSVITTALREAKEEVGLPPQSVEVVSVINRGLTYPNTIVYPVVGFIPKDFQPEVNPSEVEFAFFIPLKDFLDEEKLSVSYRTGTSGTAIMRSLKYKEGDKEVNIWGFTSLFCVFLACIVFDQNYIELYVGSENTGRVSDCIEQYFHRTYKYFQLPRLTSKL